MFNFQISMHENFHFLLRYDLPTYPLHTYRTDIKYKLTNLPSGNKSHTTLLYSMDASTLHVHKDLLTGRKGIMPFLLVTDKSISASLDIPKYGV